MANHLPEHGAFPHEPVAESAALPRLHRDPRAILDDIAHDLQQISIAQFAALSALYPKASR
jgi:hypothetical protein